MKSEAERKQQRRDELENARSAKRRRAERLLAEIPATITQFLESRPKATFSYKATVRRERNLFKNPRPTDFNTFGVGKPLGPVRYTSKKESGFPWATAQQTWVGIWPLACFGYALYTRPDTYEAIVRSKSLWFDSSGMVTGCTDVTAAGIAELDFRLTGIVSTQDPKMELEPYLGPPYHFAHGFRESLADNGKTTMGLGPAILGPTHHSQLSIDDIRTFLKGAPDDPILYTKALDAFSGAVWGGDWRRQDM